MTSRGNGRPSSSALNCARARARESKNTRKRDSNDTEQLRAHKHKASQPWSARSSHVRAVQKHAKSANVIQTALTQVRLSEKHDPVYTSETHIPPRRKAPS
eukprot:6205780-Pleurochrysis_carterae.AAC.1